MVRMNTGWKPMLHCSSERRAIARGHAENHHRGPTATMRRRKDRGRESECSPSLRTGQAVFQRPALQLMGSTVRLRASRFRDRLLALSALYASCGQVEQLGLVKEASSFDPCFQGPQHRIGPHCVFHPFPSCPQGFFVLFRLLYRSHCRQVLFTHLSSFPFHLTASLCSTVVTRFLATMDALTAALCGSSFPCAHDMNSAPYPRQLSRFQCSSL